jgi:amino acid transporter
MSDSDYGIKVFRSGLPQGVKTRSIVFFTILSLIILIQCCYWFFANSVQPILMGMPFGMFFVVLFVFLEFLALLVLYLLESKEYED